MQRRARFLVELTAELDRWRETHGRGDPGRGGDRVGEEPAGRAAGERDQRPERAGERGDGVVEAEQAGGVAAGVRQHRLLERGEWSGLDDVGRDSAGQRGHGQRGQPARESKHGSCDRHQYEQQQVGAAPADAVAVAGDQQRDERRAGE